MNNSPKPLKGRSIKLTLDSLCKYTESLDKCRKYREAKLQIDLEVMLDNKFKSFQDMIQKYIDNLHIRVGDYIAKN
jgi:hypothetical protein